MKRKICIIRVNVPIEYLTVIRETDYYMDVRVELVRDERVTVNKVTVGEVIVYAEVVCVTIHVLRNVNWLEFTTVLETLASQHMADLIDSENQ